MKNILQLFFLMAFFSCNNTSTEQAENSSIVAISKEDVLKEATKKYPDSIVLIQNLAAYYLDRQNYDGALSTINKAIAKDSNNAELRDNQSIIFAEKGDTANAIKSLKRHLEYINTLSRTRLL